MAPLFTKKYIFFSVKMINYEVFFFKITSSCLFSKLCFNVLWYYHSKDPHWSDWLGLFLNFPILWLNPSKSPWVWFMTHTFCSVMACGRALCCHILSRTEATLQAQHSNSVQHHSSSDIFLSKEQGCSCKQSVYEWFSTACVADLIHLV